MTAPQYRPRTKISLVYWISILEILLQIEDMQKTIGHQFDSYGFLENNDSVTDKTDRSQYLSRTVLSSLVWR